MASLLPGGCLAPDVPGASCPAAVGRALVFAALAIGAALSGSQDPTRTCDGISIGLGFDMEAAQRGAVGPGREPRAVWP